jgi:hypothetical protein
MDVRSSWNLIDTVESAVLLSCVIHQHALEQEA